LKVENESTAGWVELFQTMDGANFKLMPTESKANPIRRNPEEHWQIKANNWDLISNSIFNPKLRCKSVPGWKNKSIS